MTSPIDQALQARHRPKNPYPERQDQLRAIKQPPLDITPGALTGDDPSTRTAGAALATLGSTAANLAEAARTSPFDKLAPAANRAVTRADTALGNAVNTIDAQIKHYEKQRDEAIMPRISDALGSELRAHLRELKPGQIAEAAAQDARVSAAVLAAPPILTGLKQHEIDLVRSMATKAHAPEQAALLKAANKAKKTVEKAQMWSVTNLSTKVAAFKIEADDSLEALNNG